MMDCIAYNMSIINNVVPKNVSSFYQGSRGFLIKIDILFQ